MELFIGGTKICDCVSAYLVSPLVLPGRPEPSGSGEYTLSAVLPVLLPNPFTGVKTLRLPAGEYRITLVQWLFSDAPRGEQPYLFTADHRRDWPGDTQWRLRGAPPAAAPSLSPYPFAPVPVKPRNHRSLPGKPLYASETRQ